MNRRTYLSMVGVTSSGILAGCQSGMLPSDGNDEPTNVNVPVDSSRFVTETKSGVANSGMLGKITAPTYLERIELEAQFRDDSGDTVTKEEDFRGLVKDQTWNFYIPCPLGLISVPPSDGEVVVDEAISDDPPSASDVEVIESSLNESRDEYSGSTVTGRVKNTSWWQQSSLQAQVKFLTNTGTALQSGSDFTIDLPAGETWAFEVEMTPILDDPRPKATDFDLTFD